jgi:hypothetical protein
MQSRVFYSWQSDLDPSISRRLIEDCLQTALQNIHKSGDVAVQPALDRDTSDLSGSPLISEALFAQIALADVFVADLSLINSKSEPRRTPNPNVILELGFAIAHVGWDRILLVLNTAFGPVEALPFDIRGRSIIRFHITTNSPDVDAQITHLVRHLEGALRIALDRATPSSLYAGPTVPLWWGEWNTPDPDAALGGRLFIQEVGPSGFRFELSVFNGAHTGDIAGFARFVSNNLAYARIAVADAKTVCELSFHRNFSGGRREIRIDEEGECAHFRGARARFYGTFVRTRDNLFDKGVLDEIGLAKLFSITGQFYFPFTRCFQQVGDVQNDDEFSAAVTVGGIPGLFTISEGILMHAPDGRLWAAYIDANDDAVRYFTNDGKYAHVLPTAIEQWRDRFKQKEVIYDSPIAAASEPR